MLCDFDDQGDLMRCRRCGRTMAKVPEFSDPWRYRAPCLAPAENPSTPFSPPSEFRAYLADSIERNGRTIDVFLFNPPCQHMGVKRAFADGSPKTAKQTGCCDGSTITFTPTYECAIFGKCAPFAAKIEDDFDRTQPCQGCEKHSQNNLESASASHSQ